MKYFGFIDVFSTVVEGVLKLTCIEGRKIKVVPVGIILGIRPHFESVYESSVL